MKNLKIGAKIVFGFALITILLMLISITNVVSTLRTESNIDDVDLYSGLQDNANELMHILNETRITTSALYQSRSEDVYANVKDQLLYCDLKLKKLYEYIDAYSDTDELMKPYRAKIEEFEELYSDWRRDVISIGEDYPSDVELSPDQLVSFSELCAKAQRTNLLCHELLSNTISDMGYAAASSMHNTKQFSRTALWIVVIICVISVFAAAALAIVIVRSITIPMGRMRDVLTQVGQTGDLQFSPQTLDALKSVANGKDETAQCTSAMMVLVERLRSIDRMLAQVADGDLTIVASLQSERDTIGLAVQKMISNLSQKFDTIAQSTNWVNQKALELLQDSNLLESGSATQAESVSHLAQSIQQISLKTQENTRLANHAALLVNEIRSTAQTGTEKMNQMTQAAEDINSASQSISKVIKTIDDIAFQTNILALNAAVEAARAGQHGKGFAVVAEEVRNLATKSAQAAKDSGVMIEDTIGKAALGASIAQLTSESLEQIVQGVVQSTTVINDISNLSAEQASDIQEIVMNVEHVEKIVDQNSSIASRSADATGEINNQSDLLKDLVAQFKLSESPQNGLKSNERTLLQ